MEFDISKFEQAEKDARKAQKEKEKAEPKDAKVVQAFKAMGYHKFRRISSEIALNQTLPWHFAEGEVWHCISQGDVDSLTYLRVIVKQQKIKYLIISTWCMAVTDIGEIAEWIDAGYIERVDFYVGEIFTSRYANEFIALKELCEKNGGRVALFRNHSKIMAGFGEKFNFAIESSANVNTNLRCEQAVISVDTGLAYFYKEFFDDVKSFDHSFDDWTPMEVGKWEERANR